MTEPVRPTRPVTDSATRQVVDPAEPHPTTTPEAGQTPLEQMGGAAGLVYTMLPIVAFVLANASLGLMPAIGTAVAVALALSALRLVRKEPVQPALSGLFGVAVASFVAWKTGSAKGFFLLGIWSNLLLGGVFLLSVLVRRPLAGIIWGALNGTAATWLKDKPSRRYYDIATLALTGVFAARFVVQQWLYEENATGWLAFAKIAMGYPLLALALLVVVWAARSSGRRLKAQATHPPVADA
ncbi:DUF3159 domain-containing protein [Streptomyces sp. HB132]|uniref:DUF3159 domain-containing protein n=1 Tax=Streptomyces sp. HB132 TaxID=767388 RepID=UPI0019600B64|nr:DUF3159 domain-containing protein [Streptomyces sp. HB132]MBM7440196.1 hypothetical protein [Streptomyces sp. HB132]